MNVDAFPIHVAQPALGIEVVDAWLVRRARLADASLQRALAATGRRGVRRRLAHLALVRHRLDAQEVATLRLRLVVRKQLVPAGAKVGTGELLERLDARTDVGVRVDDAVTLLHRIEYTLRAVERQVGESPKRSGGGELGR